MNSSSSGFQYGRIPARPKVKKTVPASEQIVAPENSGALAATSNELKLAELYAQTTLKIASGVTLFRDVSEDLFRFTEKDQTQQQIADAVGMSKSWVNRMLKWREAGHPGGSAFGPQSKASRQKKLGQSPEQDEKLNLPKDATPAESMSGDEEATPFATLRTDLIETLELLSSCARPRMREKLALVVEKRRAALGLSWEQLINATELIALPTFVAARDEITP